MVPQYAVRLSFSMRQLLARWEKDELKYILRRRALGSLTPVNGCILQRMMTVLLMVISVLLNDPARKKEDMTEPHVIVVSNRDTRAALRAV